MCNLETSCGPIRVGQDSRFWRKQVPRDPNRMTSDQASIEGDTPSPNKLKSYFADRRGRSQEIVENIARSLLAGFRFLFHAEEVVVVLAYFFPDVPARLQIVIEVCSPGLRISLGIVDRNINGQGVMADATDALCEVQILAVRMAHLIEPGLIVETNGIDDEGVPLPFADRISHPRGANVLGMLTPIRKNLAHKMIVLEQHHDLAGVLHDLEGQSSNKIDPRHTGRKTFEYRVVRLQ